MKAPKVIVFMMVVMYLFSAAGFCTAANSIDDDGQHCVSCCSAGCHRVALPSARTTIAPSFSAFLIQFAALLRQELWVRDIEYPPKSLI